MKVWKVMILHDDENVYKLAEKVLENVKVKGIHIELIKAFSSEEAKEIINNNSDLAAMLIGLGQKEPQSRIALINYVRKDLKNDAISINLHCTSRDIREKFSLNDQVVPAYVETAELDEDKLFYMLISAINYYRKSISLENDNRVLKTIIPLLGDSGKCASTEEVIMSNFDAMYPLFAKMGIPVSVIVFIEDKFFKSTSDFEKYKKFNVDEFIKSIYPTLSVDYNQNSFRWLNNAFLMTIKHHKRPVVYVEFGEKISRNIKSILHLYFRELTMFVENGMLKREMDKSLTQIIFTLGELIETRSEETGEHVERVADYTEVICRGLKMNLNDVYVYRITSALHDIGKIGIPDKILNKPGRLTPEEFEIMKQHSLIGYEILSKAATDVLKIASNIALNHHENWDGSGYPYGVKTSEIPICGRIVTLADYYDALSSDRVYRKAWPEKKILDSIKELRGKKFDPRIVDTFFDNYDKIIRIRMNILHRQIGKPLSSRRRN